MVVEVAGTLSTFGQQVLSTRTTSARARIGTAGRHDKFAEEQFESLHLGATSNGTSTQPKSAFGSQALSHNQNGPSYRFGNRYASDHDMAKEGRPGPTTYESMQALGKQLLSQHANSPTWKSAGGARWSHYRRTFKEDFVTPAASDWRPTSGWLGDKPKYSFHGAARRADINNGLPGNKPTSIDDPAPGTYAMPSSLGGQVDSRRPTSQRTKLGTADRAKREKLYMGGEHDKYNNGKHSPAPNVYNPKLSGTSKVPGQSSFRFGSGDRFSEVKSNNGQQMKVFTPGPGTYVI